MKSQYKKAKKTAWDWFSKYIRARDCLETTGTLTNGKCCTCGRIYDFKKLHAGHFIQGRHNSILFNERGCHAQCYSCNMYKSGNEAMYAIFMLENYGEDVIKELAKLNEEKVQFKTFQLLELAEKYKTKYETLINE